MGEELFWEPDFRPALDRVVAMGAGVEVNFGDPVTLAQFRDPGPVPPQEDGVSFGETTIPNANGDHDIPVRIYRPDEPSPLRPAYLMYHGGGMSFGHLNTEHARCMELTRRCGAVGVSVDYRLAPENAASVILADGYSALLWLTQHAAELDVDPRRIALTGSSGGGGLVLALAQIARDRQDTAPMLQLVFYPNTDNRRLGAHESRQHEYPIISDDNLEQVMRNLVPEEPAAEYIMPNRTDELAGLCRAFVAIGQNDPQRDEGIDYAWRMIRAGVVTELHVFPGVSHAFDVLAPTASTTRRAYDLMTAALTGAAEAVG